MDTGHTDPESAAAAPPSYQSLADELADFHDAEFQSASDGPSVHGDSAIQTQTLAASAPEPDQGPDAAATTAAPAAAAHAQTQMAHGDAVVVTVSAEPGRVSPPPTDPPPSSSGPAQPARATSPSVRTVPVSRAPVRALPAAASAQAPSKSAVKPAPVRSVARLSSTSLLLLIGLVFISLAVVMLSYASSNTLSWPRRLWATTALPSTPTLRAFDSTAASSPVAASDSGLPRWARRTATEESTPTSAPTPPPAPVDAPVVTPFDSLPLPGLSSPSSRLSPPAPRPNISPDSGADGPVHLVTDTADAPVYSPRGSRRPRKGQKDTLPPQAKPPPKPSAVAKKPGDAPPVATSTPASASASASAPASVTAVKPSAPADSDSAAAPPLVSTNLAGVLARDASSAPPPEEKKEARPTETKPQHADPKASHRSPATPAPESPPSNPSKPSHSTASADAKRRAPPSSAITDVEGPQSVLESAKKATAAKPSGPAGQGTVKTKAQEEAKRHTPQKKVDHSADSMSTPSAILTDDSDGGSSKGPEFKPPAAPPKEKERAKETKQKKEAKETKPPVPSVDVLYEPARPKDAKQKEAKETKPPVPSVDALDEPARPSSASVPAAPLSSLESILSAPAFDINALDDKEEPLLTTDASDLEGLVVDSTGHVTLPSAADAPEGKDATAKAATASKDKDMGSLMDVLASLEAEDKPAAELKQDNSASPGAEEKPKNTKKKAKKQRKSSKLSTKKMKKVKAKSSKSRKTKAGSGKASTKTAKKTKKSLW